MPRCGCSRGTGNGKEWAPANSLLAAAGCPKEAVLANSMASGCSLEAWCARTLARAVASRRTSHSAACSVERVWVDATVQWPLRSHCETCRAAQSSRAARPRRLKQPAPVPQPRHAIAQASMRPALDFTLPLAIHAWAYFDMACHSAETAGPMPLGIEVAGQVRVPPSNEARRARADRRCALCPEGLRLPRTKNVSGRAMPPPSGPLNPNARPTCGGPWRRAVGAESMAEAAPRMALRQGAPTTSAAVPPAPDGGAWLGQRPQRHVRQHEPGLGPLQVLAEQRSGRLPLPSRWLAPGPRQQGAQERRGGKRRYGG